MIFNEIKCHVDTSLVLVGGCIPCIPPLCPRLTHTHNTKTHQPIEVTHTKTFI